MPGFAANIGATVTAYIPDDGRLIELGYTHVRFYWAGAEDGTYALVHSEALSAGQRDYSYNKTDAFQTDWWYWAPYGAGPGEGAASEPMPVGPPVATRKAIRQGVGRRLGMLEVAQVTTGTDADTVVCAALIDADASPARYANHYARAIAGNVAGETRRVRSVANSGYVPASGTLNFSRAFSATPNTSTVLELWRPLKDQDASVLVDEAINRVRRKVWWEDVVYLTADEGVTEYAGPGSLLPGAVTAAEWATGSYPDAPGWRPVEDWDVVMVGGQPVVSLQRAPGVAFPGGTVFRLVYNRFGDLLNDDGDWWTVPVDWAVAEACLDVLRQVMTPGGGREDVADAAAAIQAVADEVGEWRRALMPRAVAQVRVAR
ncbi:MAG: hypothetical protein N2109_07070 [Fimbriimonadales bacterium]|nr:hypothetical protein [Fimbriimonadales bacterium]